MGVWVRVAVVLIVVVLTMLVLAVVDRREMVVHVVCHGWRLLGLRVYMGIHGCDCGCRRRRRCRLGCVWAAGDVRLERLGE